MNTNNLSFPEGKLSPHTEPNFPTKFCKKLDMNKYLRKKLACRHGISTCWGYLIFRLRERAVLHLRRVETTVGSQSNIVVSTLSDLSSGNEGMCRR